MDELERLMREKLATAEKTVSAVRAQFEATHREYYRLNDLMREVEAIRDALQKSLNLLYPPPKVNGRAEAETDWA